MPASSGSSFRKAWRPWENASKRLAVPDDRKQEKRDLRKKYLTACRQFATGTEDEARTTAAEAETDLRGLEAELRGRTARGDDESFTDLIVTLARAAVPQAPTRLSATDPIEVRTTDLSRLPDRR